MWTWLGGSSSSTNGTVTGTFGICGTFSPTSYPPSKRGASNWIEGGFLILFGGMDQSAFQNDLWVYSTTDEIWSWMDHSSVGNGAGTYGTLGVGSTSYFPHSYLAASFAHESGSFDSFMLYGGQVTSVDVGDDLWSLKLQPMCVLLYHFISFFLSPLSQRFFL
jgi:hypothetical protein